MSDARDAERQPVARAIPEDYGRVPVLDDPVEAWVRARRCCGAPQLCGASCMDDEDSHTTAAVVRRLDEAEGEVARLRLNVAGARSQLLQQQVAAIVAGDLGELSSEDRRRVLQWLEGQR